MSYISQIILFLLALMGTLFKSTKTDDKGKIVTTSYGLPYLTKSGKVIVTLLTVSFVVTLLNTWQKSRADNQQKKEAQEVQARLSKNLNDVTQQNEGLKAGISEIIKASALIDEEQKKRFSDLLRQQKDTGNQIASDLRSSANVLQTRIDKTPDTIRTQTKRLLEDKVEDIEAVVEYTFDSQRDFRGIPNILDTKVKLEILGVDSQFYASKHLDFAEPSVIRLRPSASDLKWKWGFLLESPLLQDKEDKEFLHIISSDQSFDRVEIKSPYSRMVTQIRKFTGFHGTLGKFKDLSQWRHALVEAELITLSTSSNDFNIPAELTEPTPDDYKSFYEFYGIKPGQKWKPNRDFSVTPIPIRVTLKLFINKQDIASWEGMLTRVQPEDGWTSYYVKFPINRLD